VAPFWSGIDTIAKIKARLRAANRRGLDAEIAAVVDAVSSEVLERNFKSSGCE
jgi:hypothetical protein